MMLILYQMILPSSLVSNELPVLANTSTRVPNMPEQLMGDGRDVGTRSR